jgi:hypothetical protein
MLSCGWKSAWDCLGTLAVRGTSGGLHARLPLTHAEAAGAGDVHLETREHLQWRWRICKLAGFVLPGTTLDIPRSGLQSQV